MELGGRSAAIVLDDASVTAVVNGIVAGSFGNSGQMCVATSRVLISERLYDDVVEGVRARARDLIVGDPLNPSTEIGPLVAKRQRDRVDDLVRMAIDDGAESVAGSSFADRFPRGWFYEPTVLVNVKNTATIAQEEVFGPVVTFTTFKTDDEALSMANDSVYGLHGAVYTRDEARALDVARRVRTGSFSVNGFFTSFEMPFGGVKASGIGRKFGPEGLDAYFELKTVHNLTLAV
jgi:acyl-CoA reductase-like NAD-dependent aldehyde dehydrogenase